jgi:hypothetical protein
MRRPVDDLVRLAAAGGGFRISWRHYALNDLVRIAAAGGGHKGTLIITDADQVPLDELIRVAVAGQGTVIFESSD